MSVMARLKAAGVECYSRAEWGSVRPAAYAKRRTTHPMPEGPAPFHFLHITVTADTDTVLEGKVGARKVESYGLSTPPMVSYHGLVTNEGKWFEGQNYGVKGTHTINDKNVPGFPHDLNRYGYALAIMQNIQDAVTEVQVQVLAMGFAAAELDGFVVRGAPIYPHNKFAFKLCPGDKATALLGRIRILKDGYVRNGLPGKPTTTKDWFDMATLADLEALLKKVVPAIVADELNKQDVDLWINGTGKSQVIDPIQQIKALLEALPDATVKELMSTQIVDVLGEPDPATGKLPTRAYSSHVAYGPPRVVEAINAATEA